MQYLSRNILAHTGIISKVEILCLTLNCLRGLDIWDSTMENLGLSWWGNLFELCECGGAAGSQLRWWTGSFSIRKWLVSPGEKKKKKARILYNSKDKDSERRNKSIRSLPGEALCQKVWYFHRYSHLNLLRTRKYCFQSRENSVVPICL